MELNLLMYTSKVNIALIFREQCLSGSTSLKMLNNIMKDGKLFYSTLCDMSEIKIFKHDFKENFLKMLSDFADIFKFKETLSISMRIFKLYQNNLTFYESYGYMPININIKTFEVAVEPQKQIFYLDDYLNLSDEYENYHISHYTEEGGNFNQNKTKLKKYMKDIKTLRQSIKNFPINLKLLNDDLSDNESSDEGEDKVSELILDLRYIPDIDADRIFLDKAIKEFEQYKLKLKKLSKNLKATDIQFTKCVSELINAFILGNPGIYNIYNIQDAFLFNEGFGKFDDYIKYMDSYLLLASANIDKYIDLMQIRTEFKLIIEADLGSATGEFYLSSTEKILEEIEVVKNEPIEDLGSFVGIKQSYIELLKKTLESRTYITDDEKAIINNLGPTVSQDNVKELIKELYSPKVAANSNEFNQKIKNLNDSGLTEDYQTSIILIQEIIDIIKRSEQNYIIQVKDFCDCIITLWNTLTKVFKPENKDVELAGNICIMILNIFFNKTHPDYCGEFFGLIDGQPSNLEELNYLIETSDTSNIRYNDYYYDSDSDSEIVNTVEEADENNLYENWVEKTYNYKLQPLDDLTNYIITEEDGNSYVNKKGTLGLYKKYNKIFYKLPNRSDNCFTVSISEDGEADINKAAGSGGGNLEKNELKGGMFKQLRNKTVPRPPSFYNRMSGFITLITQNAISLSRKFLTIQKYMDGNQTESYQEIIKKNELRSTMDQLLKIEVEDSNNIKEDFLIEMELLEQSINRIRLTNYHKLFRMLYSRYSVKEDRFKLNKNGKNKLHKSEALREYLKSHLDIYLREILSKPKPEKKIKFYKFLKREYGLK